MTTVKKKKYPYAVHPHAAGRIIERFGILPEHVDNWANQILSNSVQTGKQPDGRVVMQHRTKEVFLAVDPKDNLVITVIDKPIEKVRITSPFMDAMIPQLERELYKMERDYKRKRRVLEKEHADKTLERALTLKRRARACNPNTQAILAREAKAIAVDIDALGMQINQLERDYDVAEVKMRIFIDSISVKKET